MHELLGYRGRFRVLKKRNFEILHQSRTAHGVCSRGNFIPCSAPLQFKSNDNARLSIFLFSVIVPSTTHVPSHFEEMLVFNFSKDTLYKRTSRGEEIIMFFLRVPKSWLLSNDFISLSETSYFVGIFSTRIRRICYIKATNVLLQTFSLLVISQITYGFISQLFSHVCYESVSIGYSFLILPMPLTYGRISFDRNALAHEFTRNQRFWNPVVARVTRFKHHEFRQPYYVTLDPKRRATARQRDSLNAN